MESIRETGSHSWSAGKLSEGCRLCIDGRKLVLFITGMCAQKCYYCPISERKYSHDDVYANEWKIGDQKRPRELIEEARMMGAKGAGITGGDPLMKLDRCCEYIRLLKSEFGDEFHIHLYTPLRLVTESSLRELRDAGLDEIRFHPDLDDEMLWPRLRLAAEYDWTVGIEIPAIPGKQKQIMRLINYAKSHISFINLNELELSDTSIPHYKLHGRFTQSNKLSYAVKGSRETALELLRHCAAQGINAHFCTAKLKDTIQVGERLKNRAVNAAKRFDTVTPEGMLIRGAAYVKGAEPGTGYNTRISNIKPESARKLQECMERLRIGVHGYEIDSGRFRVLMSEKDIRKSSARLKRMGFVPAIVEEYPTADCFLVELEFL